MKIPDIETFESLAFRRMVMRATDSRLRDALRRAEQNPRSLKRVPVARAIDTIAAIDDPELLYRIAQTHDPRVSVLGALNSHPLFERSWYLHSPAPEHLAGKLASEVTEAELDNGPRVNDALGMPSLYGWVRELPREERSAAVRMILSGDGKLHSLRLLSHLALDAALGLLDGITVEDVRQLTDGARMSAVNSVGRLVGLAARRLACLDSRHVEVLLSVGAPLPAMTADRIASDALPLLRGCDEGFRYLLGIGALSSQDTMETAEALGERSIMYAMTHTQDPVVVDYLLTCLDFDDKKDYNRDLGAILRTVSGLTSDTRLTIMRHCSWALSIDFVRGLEANPARPGETGELVKRLVVSKSVSSIRHFVGTLGGGPGGRRSHPAGWHEAVETLLAVAPAKALLEVGGDIGHLALQDLRSRIGDDESVWEVVGTLVDQWTGTLADLADAAVLV
jgi:hypothetical protein